MPLDPSVLMYWTNDARQQWKYTKHEKNILWPVFEFQEFGFIWHDMAGNWFALILLDYHRITFNTKFLFLIINLAFQSFMSLNDTYYDIKIKFSHINSMLIKAVSWQKKLIQWGQSSPGSKNNLIIKMKRLWASYNRLASKIQLKP